MLVPRGLWRVARSEGHAACRYWVVGARPKRIAPVLVFSSKASNCPESSVSQRPADAGLGFNTQFLRWGALFLDVDNDGWPDIFLANGHVYPEVDGKDFRTSFRERKVLYWNQGNRRFKDISLSAGKGITALFNSHGAAAAEIDNDGGVEVLVNNSHDPPSLLRN